VDLDVKCRFFTFTFHHDTKEKGEVLRLVLFVHLLAYPVFLLVETLFYSLDDKVPSLFLRKVVLKLFKIG